MKYYKVECGSGYWGMDDDWLIKSEAAYTDDDAFNDYPYASEVLENQDLADQGEECDYPNIRFDCSITELTEEEFQELIDDGWEIK